ncbi:hypothetical protein OG535_08950 [Kitasatospora sp. NBC_00085]|uniref:hypothetical protein n=1 Tax=unclassified Kitasatospora TaxID=2633591 RepID=UPI0032533140
MSTITAVTAVTTGLPRGGVLSAAWLRHRTALLTVLGVLAVGAALLLADGWFLHAAFDRSGAAGCDRSTQSCNELWKVFLREYGTRLTVGANLLYFLGGSVGAFVGGPLLAREFEHGTYRYAWTQGAGRARWTATGLALAGAVLAAGAALLGLAFDWWSAPLAEETGRFSPLLFVGAPLALAGRVLLVFAVSALAGAVLRRTVVAVGIGVGASVATTLVAQSARFHYRAPLEDTVHTLVQPAVDHRWAASTWFTDPSGDRIPMRDFYNLGNGFYDGEKLMRDGGYAVHEIYQPDDRYWAFQLIECGWMTALAVAVCAAAVWWVRRRAL